MVSIKGKGISRDNALAGIVSGRKLLKTKQFGVVKVNTGDLFSYQTCGLIVTVEKPCGCEGVGIMCCDEPMGKGKASANKARKRKTERIEQRLSIRIKKR